MSLVCKQCGSHRSDVHKCFQCEFVGSVEAVIQHGVTHQHLGGHCLLELPARRSMSANAAAAGLTIAAAAAEAKRKRFDDDNDDDDAQDDGDNDDDDDKNNSAGADSAADKFAALGDDDDFASVPAALHAVASGPKISPAKSVTAAASSSAQRSALFHRFLAEKALLDAAHSAAVAKLARTRRAEIHVADFGCAVCSDAFDVGVSDALLEHCSACHRGAHQRCRKGWTAACRDCGGRWCAECDAFARPTATVCVCGACAFCIADDPALHRQHIRHAARAYVVVEKK